MISETQHLKLTPIPNSDTNIGFWNTRQTANRDRTIPAISYRMDANKLLFWGDFAGMRNARLEAQTVIQPHS